MENLSQILATYALLAPEIIVAVGALVLLLAGAFRQNSGDIISWLAAVVMAGSCVAVTMQYGESGKLFEGVFIVDNFASFMKILVLVASIVCIFLSLHHMKSAGLLYPEFPVLILFATLGMMLMISANGLIALYLGLELQSLSLYVLAAIRRDSLRSSEAGLKYFVLGALSSGMLLYGASFIYGVTGTTQFHEIALSLQSTEGTRLELVFGIVFLLAGFAFKISAVPFHMWTPDVYEGAPTPVTAFFAAAPKIAAMALLMRVTLTAFPAVTVQWQQIIIFLSMLSMILGAFAAIGQTNIKRLLAYSSIGHMGYALVGLAAGSSEGASSVIYYLAIYLVMTLGAFACVLSMRRAEGPVEHIKELSGLAQNNLPMAFLFGAILFSLAGVPPLAGFMAKFFVFSAAIKAGLYYLAVIGLLSSVVAAYYYLRIVVIMFVYYEEKDGSPKRVMSGIDDDDIADPFEPAPSSVKLVAGLCGAFVIVYSFFPGPLRLAVETAAKQF